jgi:hypothetical protein
MLNEADGDGGSREEATGEHGDEFSDLAHRFFLLMELQMSLAIADALQEKW